MPSGLTVPKLPAHAVTKVSGRTKDRGLTVTKFLGRVAPSGLTVTKFPGRVAPSALTVTKFPGRAAPSALTVTKFPGRAAPDRLTVTKFPGRTTDPGLTATDFPGRTTAPRGVRGLGPRSRYDEGGLVRAYCGHRPPSTLVGMGGVEPPRPFGHTDLNRARLPFRHIPMWHLLVTGCDRLRCRTLLSESLPR